MHDLPLPKHPVLRGVAEEMERSGRVAQIVDHTWRLVFLSSAMWEVTTGGEIVPEVYGMSAVRRQLELPEYFRSTAETARRWWRINAPYMRHALEPGTPEFLDAFGPLAERAERIEPVPPPPLWMQESVFELERQRPDETFHFGSMRINDADGTFLGVLEFSWPALPGPLTALLARGDAAMYSRMAAMAQPERRPAALLFCDIEASGLLSRRLSSRAYFDLIRSVTTIVDAAVASHCGILGKHAGDGASAFFCASDHAGSESAACRSAIEAARTMRTHCGQLDAGGEPVRLNCGIHWGGMVVMGQVAERSRLEITALGDEVNEAARIEAAAKGGTALVSKGVVERLSAEDAAALGIDLVSIAYRPLASIDGVPEKAKRDAGSIAVAHLP